MPPNETTIGIPIYPGFDLLDVASPYEVFSWINLARQTNQVTVYLVAATLDPVSSRRDPLQPVNTVTITPHTTFAECPPLDVLWVPGGDPSSLADIMEQADQAYLDFLREQSKATRYTASVCEGALLAAAAGLLDGYQATTHWTFLPYLQLFPQVKVVNGYPRYVVDRNRITGGGISSGLDEALKLVALIADDTVAQTIQLLIQYNPHPPFKGGDPCAAPYPIYEQAGGSGTPSFDADLRAAIQCVLAGQG